MFLILCYIYKPLGVEEEEEGAVAAVDAVVVEVLAELDITVKTEHLNQTPMALLEALEAEAVMVGMVEMVPMVLLEAMLAMPVIFLFALKIQRISCSLRQKQKEAKVARVVKEVAEAPEVWEDPVVMAVLEVAAIIGAKTSQNMIQMRMAILRRTLVLRLTMEWTVAKVLQVRLEAPGVMEDAEEMPLMDEMDKMEQSRSC